MRAIALLLLTAASVWAGAAESAQAARSYRQKHEHDIIARFFDLLAIPNIASDRANIRRNAETIVKMLSERGVSARLLEIPGANPVVFGERRTPGARRTIIFYAHYDGQPVVASDWANGDPFRPVLRSASLEAGGRELSMPAPGQPLNPEWRIYARSASDDKAPVITLTTALDALDAARIPLGSNVKFFLEGEEEAGSPNLEKIVTAHRELLSGDLWIFCDGPVHQTRRQQVVFGARGSQGLNITVYGPRRELHSGHYGNWAPNPAMMLARLLASMKDDDGRVLIDGFYDGIEPLSETEKQAIAEAPNFDEELKRELLIARTEGGGRRLDELINQPSLNIRGLAAAGVQALSRNVIPAEATASIDLRLVKGIDHRTQAERVIAHIRRHGYHVIDKQPDEATRLKYPKIARVVLSSGYNGVRTSMDLEISRQVVAAVRAARGDVIRLPILGGSLPLYVFTDVLKAPLVVVPIANHDNNQHSYNENIRLQNLWDGIETMAAILAMP